MALVCLLGVMVVAWGATAGPVRTPDVGYHRSASPSSTLTPAPVPGAKHGTKAHVAKTKAHPPSAIDLSWIRYVVLAALAALALAWLARRLPRWLLRVWRDLPDDDEDAAADAGLLVPSADQLAAAVAADRAAQLAAVDGGTPRNGVVEAWSRLERIASQAGLPRHRWETSVEFTTRMLDSLPVDEVATLAARELGRLYRVARFSSHELTEADRDRARAALTLLHDDLTAARR
ncbi:MAG: hypothetical protein QOH37_1112 [Nocardioidaceae bacterium]|nr:hypothetical protein [Nocardioidaceae bacterium]